MHYDLITSKIGLGESIARDPLNTRNTNELLKPYEHPKQFLGNALFISHMGYQGYHQPLRAVVTNYTQSNAHICAVLRLLLQSWVQQKENICRLLTLSVNGCHHWLELIWETLALERSWIMSWKRTQNQIKEHRQAISSKLTICSIFIQWFISHSLGVSHASSSAIEQFFEIGISNQIYQNWCTMENCRR